MAEGALEAPTAVPEEADKIGAEPKEAGLAEPGRDTPPCPQNSAVTAIMLMVPKLGTALPHSPVHGKIGAPPDPHEVPASLTERRKIKKQITTRCFPA